LYFQALPIPGLGFSYQPPDLGLVNLPEIFFTTEPTTGSLTHTYRARGTYPVFLETV